MIDDRLVDSSKHEEDSDLDTTLRPRSFAEYIGQERVKEHMQIFVSAAKTRGEALDHVLFYGPPGLGKTTLANIIAVELGVDIRTTSGPAIERQGDLVAILSNLSPGDVLFIDEIHRLSRSVEEVLYPAMEDFSVDIVLGKGPGARSLRLDLPRFTLVGATTRAGMLTSPLRDRFGVVERLDFYKEHELGLIVARAARVMRVSIDQGGVNEVARRSRGTPRVANRLLRRVRDYALVRADGVISQPVAQEALELFEVDEKGLDRVDRRILEAIVDMFGGGPVGLETLAAATAEEAGTIEDVYEPYLMQLGFMQRTPRGRVATGLGYRYLGRSQPSSPDTTAGGLFGP